MPDNSTGPPPTAAANGPDGPGPGVDRGVDYAMSALSALSEGVVVQVASGEIVSCNPAAERILGLSRDQMAGRTSVDPRWGAIHEDGSPFPGETHPAVVTLRTGEALRGVVMGVHTPEGSLRWISINSEPIPGAHGRTTAVVTTFVDVTERKLDQEAARRGAAALHASEEKYRIVADFTNDWETWRSPDGSYLYVSPSCERITGHKASEFMTDPNLVVQITHPDDRPIVQRHFARSTDEGRVEESRMEFRILTPENETRWISHLCSPVRGEDGRWLGRRESNRDITARKQAEETLRASEEKYRWIAESIHDGVWTIDSETRTTFANRRMAEMLGYTPEEMQGKPLFAFMSAEARAEAERNVERRKQGIAEVHDFRFLRKDGSEVWTMLSTHPVVSPDGKFEGAFATVTDISSRKAAEDGLRASEDRFRRLTEELERRVEERTADLLKSRRLLDETSHLSQVGGWEVDLRTGELTWSDVTYEIHEVEKGLRRTVEQGIDYYAPESRPRIVEVWKRLVATGEPYDEELEVLTATGRRKWVRAIGHADFEDGKIVRVSGLFQDIQAHKERLAALEEANRELESFSYSVSHDLRAPIRAIDGFAKLLEDHSGGSLDEEGQRLLATVRKNSLRMGHLIDDLLAYARAARGDVRRTELDMARLVAEVLAEAIPTERRGKVEVRLGNLPVVSADGTLVRQLLLNLFENAVKFSGPKPDAVIEVGSRRVHGVVEYFVRDNGVGFDQKYVAKLFGVFQRLHSEKEFPGTGIGLSLVRRIVERHGGRVRAEGVVGEGATFSFTLGPTAAGTETTEASTYVGRAPGWNRDEPARG